MLRSLWALAVATMLAQCLGLPLSAAQEDSATPPTAQAKWPVQAATGPGGAEVFFDKVAVTEHADPNWPQPDFWLFTPAAPRPDVATPEGPFPLVIFIHGISLRYPDDYLAWIEHLVRHGAVVIYPEYQRDTPESEEATFRINLQNVVRSAVAELETLGVAIDVGKVAVVGHSYGGPLAVDYAASAAEEGLPVPSVVMGASPSCFTEEVTCLVADPGQVPAETRVLFVTESDDPDPVGAPAIERMWSDLDQVPLENRDIAQLITDGHGAPALLAVHLQAFAGDPFNKPDAFDWYGTWKWLDALMACAFEDQWCEHALGNTPEQRFMGTWSDGTPVTEPVVSDEPA